MKDVNPLINLVSLYFNLLFKLNNCSGSISGGHLDIFRGGVRTLMKAKVYAKVYTTTNESSQLFASLKLFGGDHLPSLP